MRFLRILFWLVFVMVAIVFSGNNWHSVTLRLWGAIVLDIKLPVLIALAFLAGLLPGVIVHRTSRWRLTRRLDSAERALAGVQGSVPVPHLDNPAIS